MEGFEDIPECFKELRSSDRHSSTRYQNLKDHVFTVAEKWFFCEHILGDHPSFQPPDDGRQCKTSNSLCAWAKRFGIPDSTARAWLKVYNADRHKMTGSLGGRKRSIDEIGMEEIKCHPAIPIGQLNSLFDKKHRETLERRGHIVDETTLLSSSSRYRAKQEIPIAIVKAQTITSARFNAIHDMRLVFKIAAIVYAFSSHLDAYYKWNMDATTIEISKSFQEQREQIMVTFHGAGYKERVVQDEGDKYHVYLKWFHFCSAAGTSGPLVLIIAVDAMPDETFHVERVNGLKHDTVAGSPNGWLYAAKSRAGNPAMWKHFFMHVIIPTLRANKLENPREFDETRTFFHSDGEAIIMNSVLDEEVMTAFTDVGVDFMKGGPSATSQHQPIDVSPIFRDTKTEFRKRMQSGTRSSNPTLEAGLKSFFKNVEENLPTSHSSSSGTSSGSSSNTPGMTSGYKNLIIQGVMRLIDVLRNRSVTSDKMRLGFSLCGQHVEDVAEPSAPTVSYERIMRQIRKDSEGDEYLQNILEQYTAKFPQVVEIAKANGHVTNQSLDDLGLPRLPDSADRDDSVLCRQDAQIITHDDSIRRIQEYYKKRSPEYKDEQAKLEAARKVVYQLGKEKARQEKRVADKKAEEDRQKAMTKQQLDAERHEKKMQVESKKQKVREAKEAAMKLLGEGEATRQLMSGAMAIRKDEEYDEDDA